MGGSRTGFQWVGYQKGMLNVFENTAMLNNWSTLKVCGYCLLYTRLKDSEYMLIFLHSPLST